MMRFLLLISGEVSIDEWSIDCFENFSDIDALTKADWNKRCSEKGAELLGFSSMKKYLVAHKDDWRFLYTPRYEDGHPFVNMPLQDWMPSHYDLDDRFESMWDDTEISEDEKAVIRKYFLGGKVIVMNGDKREIFEENSVTETNDISDELSKLNLDSNIIISFDLETLPFNENVQIMGIGAEKYKKDGKPEAFYMTLLETKRVKKSLLDEYGLTFDGIKAKSTKHILREFLKFIKPESPNQKVILVRLSKPSLS